ncbi:MAG: PIN domain-containing protein [Clostridiales bacterium]|nr:PIN domain-containing protein [Clostridiales bacterium]
MKILVDTNVILDVLLNRTEFINDSLAALEKASLQGDRLYFSSSSVTDVYYLIRKQTQSKEMALDAIKKMAEFLVFAEVNGNCILAATVSKLNDYEDAVVDAVASNVKADYIMTRNLTDFKNANNKVMSPTDFVNDTYY